MSTIKIVMIKADRPTVDEARERLRVELEKAKNGSVVVLKIVHGYGSSGQGGALREAIRRSLRKRVKEGAIRTFQAGEGFSTFDETARLMLDECPELARDPDFNRYNEGVTFVLL